MLTVLLPYYGSGMHFPSTPPGTSPTLPDEFYGISLFRGTLWQDRFWTDLFWNVGCNGWCLWLPALLLVGGEMITHRRPFTQREKWVRSICLGISILAGILWFLASLSLLGE